MAAPQWTGGKCKSVQQAKAFFRHNDKDRREETNHANEHIDKSKTKDNFTYRGLDYKGLCKAFDDKMASVDQGKPGSGKNARVVLQSVILYPPKGLTREQEKDWFMDAGEVMEAQFGDNLLEIQFDMDEEHEYIDPDTGEKVMSRNHGHARLFPEVNGKLNGKAFSSRASIKALNHALDVMSVKNYGVPMIDGTGRSGGGATVESLKAKSLRAEVEQLEERAGTILTNAMDRAAEITTEARRDARATRREADQDREQARRDRNAAYVEREDAEEYARTTRKQADRDAQGTKAQAEREAEATRKAAEKDAQKIRADAQAQAEAGREIIRQKIRAEVDEAKQERDQAIADRDKARTARKATQAALQGDLETWAGLTSRPTAKALLGVLGAAVEASHKKEPEPSKSEFAGAYARMMSMVRGQTTTRKDGLDGPSGPGS